MPFPPKSFPSKKPFPPSGPGKLAPSGGPPDDLDAPDPLDKMDAPGPAPKKPAIGPPGGDPPAEESAETPGYEGAEEQGAKLISDIESAGEQFGLDPDTSRGFAASVFDAMAKCLRGDAGGDDAGAAEMPIDRYGR